MDYRGTRVSIGRLAGVLSRQPRPEKTAEDKVNDSAENGRSGLRFTCSKRACCESACRWDGWRGKEMKKRLQFRLHPDKATV